MNEEFYKAWFFIQQHPKFMFRGEIETFPYGLDIMVVLVNPKTLHVDDDDEKNTKLQIWLEYGAHASKKDMGVMEHDIRLDCGADTFEQAIIKLAKLVRKHYGDY